MPKRKKDNTDWVITKGQLASWQKEQKRRRQIIIAGSVVVALVVALVVYAVIDISKPDNPTILKIDGPQGERSFSMDDFVDRLRLYGIQRTPTFDEARSMAESTLQSMESNEIFSQLAADLDIAVIDEEINARIVNDYTPPPTQSGTDAPINPATPSYDDIIGQISRNLDLMGVSMQDFRYVVAAEILRDKVQAHIGKVEVPDEVEQAHILGIQIDTAPSAPPAATGTLTFTEPSSQDPEETRQIIVARLKAGEDFSVLAEEFSSYGGNGDLGWFPREMASMFYGEEFASVAFTLEWNTLSELIPSDPSDANTRYWVLQIPEREDRTIEEDYRPVMESQAFTTWYENQIVDFDIDRKYQDDDGNIIQEDIDQAINKALS